MDNRKDFFISYTSADQKWAEWIAFHLEEAGYSTVIRAWDFRPGGNTTLETDKAIKETKRSLLVLSHQYTQEVGTHQTEWAAAFTQEPTGTQGNPLPVRIEECQPSGLLKPISYIDLVGLKETAAKQRLLEGIHTGRMKPDSVSFPGLSPIPERPTFPPLLPPKRAERPATGDTHKLSVQDLYCPRCLQIDCVKKVSSFVESITTAGQTAQSSKLTPPSEPRYQSPWGRYSVGFILFSAVTFIYVLCVFSITTPVSLLDGTITIWRSEPTINDFLIVLAIISAGIVTLIVKIYSAKKNKEIWSTNHLHWRHRVRVWNALYYCSRDDVVFLPGKPESCALASQMNELLDKPDN